MSKLEQILQLDPPVELKFRGPFNATNSSRLRLTNPSEKRIMFKIKTTAPKKYCVRPNSGILEPSDKAEVDICLQPCMYDPTEKNKHKFMVQSAFAPNGDINLENIWKDIIPDHLMDSKLRCVFDIATDPNEVEEEPHNFTPRTASTPVQKGSVDGHLQRNVQEVEDELFLRQENMKLKDEIKQLREIPGQMPFKLTWTHVVCAVVLAVVGVALGKYII
ncbi:unnamed protein product [Phaedon cochleariae]|uniref:MSP domain-containing protein n=1 Tax=Phaedon cochleariae TaxID=80249 RepID=A0A9P0DAE1_PHACE|nr:unnamed protein product [Phaedon cochleariae]